MLFKETAVFLSLLLFSGGTQSSSTGAGVALPQLLYKQQWPAGLVPLS